MYDQHSSEEELEVINGPNSSANSADEHSDEVFDDESPKRSSSTIIENRKRSLAQSSDDEVRFIAIFTLNMFKLNLVFESYCDILARPQVRNLLENVPAPVVNFRTSPPLEALKPHRGHILYQQQQPQQQQPPQSLHPSATEHQQHRSATPLILTESGRGIESIRISCDNDSSPAMSMDVRSISPPAKLFHCAVSPRRRPSRHAPQRLQRPHRPCLDFDKMQQVSQFPVTF